MTDQNRSNPKRTRRIPLELKLLVMCGLMLACPLAAAVVTLHALAVQTSLAARINLAGRQRMLTQRFAKEVLDDVAFGNEKPDRNAPWQQTRKLFETTIGALHGGGTTYRDLKMTRPIVLEAETDPEIRAKLDGVRAIWGQMQHAARGLQTTRRGTAEFERHLADFRRLNVQCLKEMNAAVKMLENTSGTYHAAVAQYTAGAISFAIFLVVLFYIRHRVITPIKSALRLANAVSVGDLTQTCEVITNDEVGELAEALNNMGLRLRQIVREISGTTASVHEASEQLSDTAEMLTDNAHLTATQSTSVASAAERMSGNLKHMSGLTDRMTANIKNVSVAINEMTGGVAEIAKNAEHASAMADNVAHLVGVSNANIGQLGEAAQEIGKVVETIQDIAEQTNLLALNATIEAARAGEAGKGFAVVATEVKELAKQTAVATEDIRRRIGAIQGSTAKAVESIGQISEVIGEVTEFSKSIASAVEDQTVRTRGIAQNIDEASEAAELVAVAASETASSAGEITRTIASVDDAAQRTAGGADRTHDAALRLSQLAQTQQAITGRFRTGTSDGDAPSAVPPARPRRTGNVPRPSSPNSDESAIDLAENPAQVSC